MEGRGKVAKMEANHQCRRLIFFWVAGQQRRIFWRGGRGIGGALPIPLECRAKPPTPQVDSFFWMWRRRRPTMPQVDFFSGGMRHQRRRKRRQRRCKHGTKPPTPQVDFFPEHGVEGGQQRRRLIVFWGGCSIGGGNVTKAAGNTEQNQQCCRCFFGRGIV